MASRMDNMSQGGCKETVLPICTGQTRDKINLTPKLAAVLTGHGKTTKYLHRFNLRDEAICICSQGDQTMVHLLFHCKKTNTQREALKDT